VRQAPDFVCHPAAEFIPVHGKGVPGRDLDFVRNPEQEAVQTPQFLFQKMGSGSLEIGFERVAANQFTQLIGRVRRCGAGGPHLEQAHFQSPARNLPCRFGTRKAAAYNRYGWLHLEILVDPAPENKPVGAR
jgi:hypothetical protein